MDLETLNKLHKNKICAELIKCCTSLAWVEKMAKARPFQSQDDFLKKSEQIWFELSQDEWFEAFENAHQKIKENLQLNAVKSDLLLHLHESFLHYQTKFGFPFVLFDADIPAAKLLQAVDQRLNNSFEVEISNAAREQINIISLRLLGLLQ